MKRIIERIIQRRNPQFQFDSSVTSAMILNLTWEKSIQLLRSYRLLLRGMWPQCLLMAKGVELKNVANISLGKYIKLGQNVYLNALGKGRLTIGNNVGIGAYSRVIISTSFNNIGSHITIGNNVGIGEYAYLGGGGGLEIDDDCIIGQYFSCHPENHNYEKLDELIREQGVSRRGIQIGKNCWIGAKVTILDGVTIGDGCVIASGAVVTKNILPNSIVGGVPAKMIKSRNLMNQKIA